MANIASLLSSGDYADLKIVCKDQEFQVHKIIVCAQSPVLATALKGYFEETKINTYHVTDFDPTTVKCMIDYMYSGKYAQMPPDCRSDSKDQACGKSSSEVWTYHGLVNCIADYFGVPGLAKMATSTLDELTQKGWSEDAFCNLLYGTHGRTTDKGFRTMLATRAVDHLGELTARGLFSGADVSDELTPTILRLCDQRLKLFDQKLKLCDQKLNLCDQRLDAQAESWKKIESFFDDAEGDCDECGSVRCYVAESSGIRYCTVYCISCERESAR
ncbi:BTB/POZ protein [Xylaria scruposa]|nr:BTB/POZ protein [Xylaria scruposa]